MAILMYCYVLVIMGLYQRLKIPIIMGFYGGSAGLA